jgi:hypothetical protein
MYLQLFIAVDFIFSYIFHFNFALKIDKNR